MSQRKRIVVKIGSALLVEPDSGGLRLDWLKGLGSLKDIHIGRVENADGDYAQIITALSERSSRIPSSGVTLPRLNATNATETEKVSHDPAIRRIVEEIYAEDFEAFGY